MNDHEALRRLKTALAEPDLFEEILKASGSLPKTWREWSPERRFEFLRCRLGFTQEELGIKAGLVQSQISRVEGGGDALLSTWTKLYAAMGFELVMLPVSDLTMRQLRERAELGRPRGHHLRQRARPRRRWMRLKPH